MHKEKLLNYIKENITSDHMTLSIIENIVDYANNNNFHCIHSSLYFIYDMLKDIIDFEELEPFEDLSNYSI